jgi:hypothetical protein
LQAAGKEEVMMKAIARLAFLAVAAFWSLPSFAQSPPLPAEWVNALRAGGYVIVLRHGATHADQADTDPFKDGNGCYQPVVRIQADEWSRLAHTGSN